MLPWQIASKRTLTLTSRGERMVKSPSQPNGVHEATGRGRPCMIRVPMDNDTQILWEDGERVFCRQNDDGRSVLIVRLSTEYPSPACLDRLAHEFGLKNELDGAWAARPLEFERE